MLSNYNIKYICTIHTRLDTCLMSISRFSLRDKVTLRLLKLYFYSGCGYLILILISLQRLICFPFSDKNYRFWENILLQDLFLYQLLYFKMESKLIFVRISKLKLNHSFVFCFMNEFHTVVSIILSWGEESSI
jgi:hypothetical protein